VNQGIYIFLIYFTRVLALIWVALGTAGRECADSAGIPIEHFIYIIQEKHSVDHYFGTTFRPEDQAFANYAQLRLDLT
jgi:phospholipase C